MTAATPEARAKARAQRLAMISANPDQLCPEEHRHGETSTCYNSHGCRCVSCCTARAKRRARSDWEANRLSGRDVWVPAVGAQRRLQALAVMGWSADVIAEKIGSHYRPLMKIRAGERKRVRLSNHRRIAAVFEVLAMKEAPGQSGLVARGYARERGWVPPLSWTDIDNPRERPKGKK